jgi:hypothetical protein
MGPATKFLYSLREFSGNKGILIVDDDKICPRVFIGQIAKYSNLYPNYALGYSGWRVPPGLTDRPTTFWLNLRRKPPAPAAFFVDDVWISPHCMAPKFIFPAMRFCVESLAERGLMRRTSLGRLNSGNGDHAKRNNTLMLKYLYGRSA